MLVNDKMTKKMTSKYQNLTPSINKFIFHPCKKKSHFLCLYVSCSMNLTLKMLDTLIITTQPLSIIFLRGLYTCDNYNGHLNQYFTKWDVN